MGKNKAAAVPLGNNKRTSTAFNTDDELYIKTIPWMNKYVSLSSPFCPSN
ncbi:hypothetical protein [Marinococcus halophilus]|nr:hypothetical protein [Marinococcus halophilus]